MAYAPEAEARIRELEEEIRKLKENNASILVWPDLKELLQLTGLRSQKRIHAYVSWLSRLATCGLVSKRRFSNGAYIDKMCIKYPSELSFYEVQEVTKCAQEMVDVLLKYARQIKQEGENE